MADNVKLVLEFDSTGAIQGVQNFGSKLFSETEKASSSLAGLGASMKGIGAAVAAYFTVGAVKDFIGTIVSEAIEAEESLNQLNGALARAGTYSEKSSKQMQEFANQMMKTTTIDDDVVLGQLAIARSYAKSDEQARKLVKSAAELSAARNIPLDTAVEQLGRTLDGTAGKLNEVVPALRGVSSEALKAGAAIDIVGESFQNAAANKLFTFDGAMKQLSNTIGNFLASLGKIITENPVVIQGIKELTNIFSNLDDKVNESRKTSDNFVTQGLLGMLNGIRGALPFINALYSAMKTIASVFKVALEAVMAFVDGVNLIAIGFQSFYQSMRGLKPNMEEFDRLLVSLRKRGAEMIKAFDNMGKDLFDPNDIKNFDDILARLANAAKKNPVYVNVKGDTSNFIDEEAKKKMQEALENSLKASIERLKEAEIAAKIEAEENPKKPADYSDTTFATSLEFEMELILSPFKAMYEMLVGIQKKSTEVVASIAPNFMKMFDEVTNVIETFQNVGTKSFKQIGDDIAANLPNIEKAVKESNKYWESQRPEEGEEQAEGKNLLIDVAKPIAGAFNYLYESIASIDFSKLFLTIGTEFEELGTKIVDFAKNVAAGAVGGGVAVATTTATSMVGNISKGKEGVMPVISDAMGALGGAFDKAFGTGNMIGDIIRSLMAALSNPETLKGMIDGFVNAIPTIIDSLIAAIPTLFDGLVRAFPMLLDGIIKLIPVLFQAIAKAIGPILITIAEKLPDIIIAIAENIGPIIEAIADALPTIIEKLVAAIPRVATALVKAFLGIVWTLISKAIPNIIKGLLNGISKMFNNIGRGSFQGISSKSIGDKLSAGARTGKMKAAINPVEQTKKFAEWNKDITKKIWEQGVMKLVDFFKNLGQKIWDDGVMKIVDWFKELGSKIWNDGVMKIVNWFAEIGQKIWDDGVMKLIDWFVSLGTSIWNQGILPLVNFFADLVNKIWNDGVLALVNWFASLASKIWTDGIKPLVDWFSSLPANMWNALLDAFDKLVGGGKKLSINSLMGKAKGGVVPSGYPNDSYPAALTSGELVIPAETTPNLIAAIKAFSEGKMGGGSNNEETNSLLRQLIALISGQETIVNVQIDRNTLARAILTLNNDNRRIA